MSGKSSLLSTDLRRGVI